MWLLPKNNICVPYLSKSLVIFTKRHDTQSWISREFERHFCMCILLLNKKASFNKYFHSQHFDNSWLSQLKLQQFLPDDQNLDNMGGSIFLTLELWWRSKNYQIKTDHYHKAFRSRINQNSSQILTREVWNWFHHCVALTAIFLGRKIWRTKILANLLGWIHYNGHI